MKLLGRLPTREIEHFGSHGFTHLRDELFFARARTAEGEERERLWRKANEVWPHYDEYAKRTERVIPVVVLDRL